MDFLVMIEERSDHSPVLARVDSVPALLATERRSRDVVTLYGTPDSESLALALAAAAESRRTAEHATGAFRHLGIWPERGAVGDAAWRDSETGELVTRDVEIPLDVLTRTARALLEECGTLIRRLVAGLAMPDWPEGTWRAIGLSLDSVLFAPHPPLALAEGVLETVREADGFTYDLEGD